MKDREIQAYISALMDYKYKGTSTETLKAFDDGFKAGFKKAFRVLDRKEDFIWNQEENTS